VKTPLGDGALDGDDLRLVKLAFDDAYEAAYGRRLADLSAKSLTWRVLASGPQPGRVIAWDHDAAGEARKGERDVFFPELGRMPCAVYERGLLSAGAHLTGPALVEERVSTLVVPPNAHAVVDERMNVIVSLGAVRAGAAEGRVTATSPETAPNPGAR
jgi:N-methylhydantoinase A